MFHVKLFNGFIPTVRLCYQIKGANEKEEKSCCHNFKFHELYIPARLCTFHGKLLEYGRLVYTKTVDSVEGAL